MLLLVHLLAIFGDGAQAERLTTALREKNLIAKDVVYMTPMKTGGK